MSDSATLDREFYADGTRYDDDEIQGVVWDFPEFLEWTEIGLTNAIAHLQKAVTETSGVIYGHLEPEPNPDSVPNTVRIGTGYAIIPDGSILYLDSELDITGINDADEGKNIILKRSRGHYNERNVRVNNVSDVPVLRKHTVSSDIVASGDLESTDVVVYTITDVDAAGAITGHSASVNYYIPEMGPPGSMDPDRLEPASINDMMSIPAIPSTLAEQVSYLASLINKIVHGDARYLGGYDDLNELGEPDPVTNVAIETNMMESFVYDDLSVGIENNLCYIKISWGAAAAGPDPHYYVVELIPINKFGGVDQEITSKTLRYNTKDYSTSSTVTEITVFNIPPNIKFKPRVAAVKSTVFEDMYSDWANGSEFYSGGGESGVSVPDGGAPSLTISGGKRKFDVSWSSVSGAAFYNIYVREGTAPTTSDDTYLYKKEHKSSNITVNWGSYSDLSFYFVVVPYNSQGVAASWSMGGNATMSTDDVSLSSDERDSVANGTSMLAGLQSLVEQEGASNPSGALKSYTRVEDTYIPAVKVSNITPSAVAGATTRDDSWISPGGFVVKRIVATTYNNNEVFEGSTVIYVFINDDQNDDLTLTCRNGDSYATITDVNFGTVELSAGNIVYGRAACSSAPKKINFQIDVAPYYPTS